MYIVSYDVPDDSDNSRLYTLGEDSCHLAGEHLYTLLMTYIV